MSAFQWSSSSRHVLVASFDQIHVFSAVDGNLHATIRNPVPPAAKPVFVGFASSDAEVCVCASLGLKFAIFHLLSSKAVEVVNPKFHTVATAARGFCFRPKTRHLAIMTRTSGKDMISIHDPVTKDVQRSWYPDTIDAQGLMWSPDGRWLVTWEAAGHGHKVLFYTPDGNLFKIWSGPQDLTDDAHVKLGAGVRLLECSADGRSLAIADCSKRVCMLNMTCASEAVRFNHPGSIVPTDTLQVRDPCLQSHTTGRFVHYMLKRKQVWQEQVSHSGHEFIRASQTIYPPTGQVASNTPAKGGCCVLSFDSSSALLATKLEDCPSTIWIWDISAAELRAVLVFHADVSRIAWHPSIRETLLVRCEGEQYNGLAFVWDPLSYGPRPVDFAGQFPTSRLAVDKTQAMWLGLEGDESGTLFASTGKDYLLASLVDSSVEDVPWLVDGESSGLQSAARTENSLLFGTPALGDDAYDEDDDGGSEVDDTFLFKRT